MKKIITYNYLNIQSMELHTEKKSENVGNMWHILCQSDHVLNEST